MDNKEELEIISEWPVTAQDTLGKRSTNISKVKKRKFEETGTFSKIRRLQRSEEPLVSVAVAKWWRKQAQDTKQCYTNILPRSNNSDTLLAGIMRLDITQDFMQSEIKRLTVLLKKNGPCSNLTAVLGSFYEKLGNFEAAKQHLEKAVSLDDTVAEYRWLLGKVKRQVKVQEEQRSALVRLPTPESALSMPVYQKVDRVSATNLTAERFYEEYSSKHKPVIITDIDVTAISWTLQYLKTQAGECTVTLKHSVENSCEWARLENKEQTTVSDYINRIERLDETGDPEGYLFDWSLPIHCPKLVQELRVPRYFAGDFLQRTTEGSLYRDSWPSLFVAPAGLCSELHVDAFGSNFWMAMFQGSKRWVFFPRSDLPHLYPQYPNNMDPVFEADIANPDLERQPLLHLTCPSECVLSEGEILFVPAGCPHRVENLTTSVAISANFVDLSNWTTVLEELELSALVDPRSNDLLKQFKSNTFDKTMLYYNEEVPWSKFKGATES
ncbi:bifunctional arginine demethylase and lysyl-hydroxylase JMJD6-B-like isoform X2 [Ostrea edulis]|uniref:bifunctional arginine demethylase and lysyl-hydroxylase JMJD6-B-like isoform X2 n=1 Tax=Ostrea edulis TaxID=37623 RepID=UPI0024AE9BB0|nr:bifunctional arginine demethylase and lysyl-hydroxylase JMJD6-B-like isoform X2 [Ostrea edulis]